MTSPTPRPSLRWLPPLIVALATIAAFSPGLRGQFLNWDDDTNFLNNLHYRGLGPANLRWMFTDYFGHYMPLTWLTLGLDYVLWGMNPLGYHATNLLLHALNAVLCFLVFQSLLRHHRPEGEPGVRNWIAAAGALFFSLHPLRVESVAWVTERRDLTSGFFFLLTIWTYLRWVESRRRSWLGVSVGCFVGMILSKAMGMTLPLVLLVIDAVPLRRFSKEKIGSLLLEKIPYLALLSAAVVLTVIGQRKAEALYSREAYPLVHSFAQPGYRISFYLLKTLLPIRLSPLYWFRPEIGWAQAVGWGSVLAVTGAVFVKRRAWPAAAAAWISYLLLIAPVSGVFQAGPHFAADRYTYLACLPFAALAAAALLQGSETRFRQGAAAVTVLALAGLAVLSANQCLVWRDSLTLWNHALRLDPDLYLAYNNRGTARTETGDWDGAVEDYNRSIAIYPGWAKPWFNRGAARAVHGDHAGAIGDFSRALELDPRHVDALAARAISRSKRGEIRDALADCDEAIRINPGAASGYAARGSVRLERRDFAAAIADYTRALEITPTPNDYKNRGLAHDQAGRIREAVADYSRSLELRPNHVDTLLLRATGRSKAGDFQGAMEDFGDAIRLKPDPSLFMRRAAARGMSGDFDGAIADCSEAIRLKPGYADAYLRRGMARMERKDTAGAVQDFEKALDFSPQDWPQRPEIEELLRKLRPK